MMIYGLNNNPTILDNFNSVAIIKSTIFENLKIKLDTNFQNRGKKNIVLHVRTTYEFRNLRKTLESGGRRDNRERTANWR